MKGNTPIQHEPTEIPDEIVVGPKGNLGALNEVDTDFVEQSFAEVFAIISESGDDVSKLNKGK